MKMINKLGSLLPIAILATMIATAQAHQPRLVWSDEFEYAGKPDSTKWGYDLGTGCPDICGWGNNELQYYTKRAENVRVENGMLVIEARKENYQGSAYSSARIVTKNKADWTYGRFEIKARIPSGKGSWSAIWMLPTHFSYGGWPHSGEIDIMENVGWMPDSIFGTVHTGAYNGMKETQKTKSIPFNDLSRNFHRYAVEWKPESISFFVDDILYNEFRNEQSGTETWPFDKPFHLLLNLAVGGNWGGKKGIDESSFPQKMEVEYVRVYEFPR